MSEHEVMMVPGLSAAESAALEVLFTQDLPGGPTASISRRVGSDLVAKGLAAETSFVVGHGPLAVKVDTFNLTIAGHLAYCAACADLDETEG